MICSLKQTMQDITIKHQTAGYFPSAVVSVTDRERTLFRFAVGDAREDSLFDVASLTKIATATQVLLVVEAGVFRLSTPLLSLLPELSQDRFLSKRLQGITVFALLTHCSTLPAWYPFYTGEGDFTRTLALACERPPETVVTYSDINFILLGKILEKVHAMPLDVCLQQHLVKPHQIGHMLYTPPPELDILPSSFGNPIEEAMCSKMGLSFDGWRPHTPLRGQVNDGNAHYFMHGVSGHAGIFANADAYERLLRLYLTTPSPLLSSALNEQTEGRGLGWQVGRLYPHGCGHTGFTGTSLYLSRDKGIGCVILTNRLYYPSENTHSTNDLRLALHQALADTL